MILKITKHNKMNNWNFIEIIQTKIKFISGVGSYLMNSESFILNNILNRMLYFKTLKVFATFKHYSHNIHKLGKIV
jgi:hypothetical protein